MDYTTSSSSGSSGNSSFYISITNSRLLAL